MNPSTETSVTTELALGFTGALGNIDAYISTVNRLPMLTQEEETKLARALRDQNDLAAASKWCCRICV